LNFIPKGFSKLKTLKLVLQFIYFSFRSFLSFLFISVQIPALTNHGVAKGGGGWMGAFEERDFEAN
jgi:hypothetical protein